MVLVAAVLVILMAVRVHSNCVVGFVEHQDQGCVCGSNDGLPFAGRVVCNKDRNSSRLRSIVCITPESSNESSIVAGYCPLVVLNKPQLLDLTIQDQYWTNSDLYGYMCSPMNRTGTLCGHCVNGTAINIHSVIYQCIPESHCGELAWLWYVLGELGPLTVLFVVIIVFRPKLISPSMNAFLLLAQVYSMPNILAETKLGFSAVFSHNVDWPVYIQQVIYGMFNLQLSWVVSPILCLGPGTNILTVFVLQYLTALYPLFLCVVFLVVLELHHYNCRPLVWLTKPIASCCIRFQYGCKLGASLIDCLASLFVLSFIKISNVSAFLLLAVPLISVDGKVLRYVLYYDGSITMFGHQHVPYAVLALCMLTMFTWFPVAFLVLYQSKHFQKCLQRCHLQRPQLTMFVELFQGGFKDGTNGDKDLRFFAGVYFFIRAIVALLATSSSAYLLMPFLSIIISVAFATTFFILKPYKNNFYNHLDGLALLYLAIVIALNTYKNLCLSIFISLVQFKINQIIVYLLVFIPAIYLAGMMIRSNAVKRAFHRVVTCFWQTTCCVPNSPNETTHLIGVMDTSYSRMK